MITSPEHDQAVQDFGWFVVGVMDGYLLDGASPEHVLEAILLGAKYTGVPLPYSDE